MPTGKIVLITIDPAVQDHRVRHPGLRLVRRVEIKEVGGIEIPVCLMRRSLGGFAWGFWPVPPPLPLLRGMRR